VPLLAHFTQDGFVLDWNDAHWRLTVEIQITAHWGGTPMRSAIAPRSRSCGARRAYAGAASSPNSSAPISHRLAIAPAFVPVAAAAGKPGVTRAGPGYLCAVRKALTTRATPWFALAALLLVIALAALHGMAAAMVGAAALFVCLGACLRALVLTLRDDDVAGTTIRGPAGRTLGAIGADAARRRRGRVPPR
jgi:hypothetical protein